jgi:hypothetical protein
MTNIHGINIAGRKRVVGLDNRRHMQIYPMMDQVDASFGCISFGTILYADGFFHVFALVTPRFG